MIYFRTSRVIIITLFAGIAACSFKLLYNNLDELIPDYVEDFVTLDDVLEQKFEQRTLLLLDWHRNTQLRQYADWMRAVQQDIGVELTIEKAGQRIDEVEAFWVAISERINDEMANLLPLLSEQQQQELFSNLAESNADFREEYIDIDEADRRDQYYEDLYETYESWIGALSDEQDDAINKASHMLVSTAELRLQRRMDWQNGIQEILKKQDSNEYKSQRMHNFLTGFENSVNKAMQEKSVYNRKIIAQLTVQISLKMSQVQKDFFISRTDEYIRIFTELAEKSGSTL